MFPSDINVKKLPVIVTITGNRVAFESFNIMLGVVFESFVKDFQMQVMY
ncbi:hypothetical protein C427_5158 [Paraglaciecola psychrophila 170]|uniref:Uncharacterized protein n=1 Tax=Paraglaciecola psychrophila 170 TaxID=1129794 RepID=K7AAJ6_9ALTE|nr:hypothetical protein C427_5158 [Paraglaciecola psychrophila 170]GAC37753.1 hypothetical protein GPSY_2131 [Paraglaciecola psychrophila 170]